MMTSYYAEADQEEHYLLTAGITTSCSCSRCEQAAEYEARQEQAAEEVARRAATYDAMSVEELEAAAFAAWFYAEIDRRHEMTACPF